MKITKVMSLSAAMALGNTIFASNAQFVHKQKPAPTPRPVAQPVNQPSLANSAPQHPAPQAGNNAFAKPDATHTTPNAPTG